MTPRNKSTRSTARKGMGYLQDQYNYTKQLDRNDNGNLKSYSQRPGDEPDTKASKSNTRLLPSLIFILCAVMLCHCHLDRSIILAQHNVYKRKRCAQGDIKRDPKVKASPRRYLSKRTWLSAGLVSTTRSASS